MTDLLARLEAAAAGPGAITFLCGEAPARVTWAELHRDASAMAAGFTAEGLRPGQHVAILGPTTRQLVTAIQATWLAGATVVVLPLPMRMSSIEEFVAKTRQRIAHADTDLLLIDPQLAPFYEAQPGDPATYELGSPQGDGAAWRRPPADPDRLAILQFTSGSTADPKGVMLPERTLCANLDAICEAGRLAADEVFVSWLPLYHDMGLVGMLTVPMTTGTDLVLAAPQDFMASPASWMQWMSDHHGTVTAGPNFAWVLATRALHRLADIDLSAVRIALNGAEPVDPATVEAFVEAGAAHGLHPGTVFPAFGMAELGIGGTFPEPLTGLRTDDVDQRVLETERYAAPSDASTPGTRRLAKLGRPVPGLEIRIVDPDDGRVRGEREVGELEIRGTSVMPGYYKRPDITAAAFHDGWLRTGDLGYLVDGELVLCGRLKDMIIVGGRNVFPEDIEKAVGTLDRVRAGNVIAFGADARHGGEDVVVVAEVRAGTADVDASDGTGRHGKGDGVATSPDGAVSALRSQIRAAARDASGVTPKHVVLVPAGTLPKTSSGKLQRSLCRARWQEGTLEPAPV